MLRAAVRHGADARNMTDDAAAQVAESSSHQRCSIVVFATLPSVSSVGFKIGFEGESVMAKEKFSARECRYLLSLSAVRTVRENRIFYSEEFKQDCMRRYHEGESPSQIFREAGLSPELVGSKRIERCMARWREEEHRRNMTSSSSPDFDSAWVQGRKGAASSSRRPSMGEGLDYGGAILMRYENRLRMLEKTVAEMSEQIDRLEKNLRQRTDIDAEEAQK